MRPPPPPPGSTDPNCIPPDSHIQLNTAAFLLPRFFGVASLTLCVWDWLLQAADEYEMVRKSKQRLSRLADVLYFTARICPIAYIWSNVIIQDGFGSNCQTVIKFAAVANIIAVPAISLLFLLRVSAVYLHNKIVMATFGICWFGLLCSFVLDSITVFSNFVHLDESRPCELAGRTIDGWSYIASAIFDTLVFLAISWRLVTTSVIGTSWGDRLIKSFVRGEGLLHLSKALLRGGQLYYVVVIGFSLATAATTLIAEIPNDWGLLAFPNIAIQSVMACHLFRELKLGGIVDPWVDQTGINTSILFASTPHADMELNECASHMHESNSSGIVEILDESDGVSQSHREATVV